MANLFQLGDFTLAGGARAAWKIECDALTSEDWTGLAAMAAEILPPFCTVFGVPLGGMPFARSLAKYETLDVAHPFLIAEDVVTTGGSMERFRARGRPYERIVPIGVCVFARGPVPAWVVPLFRMPGA